MNQLPEHRRAIHGRTPSQERVFSNCTGPCQQGRLLCPCPEACQEIADEPRNARPLLWYVSELVGAPPAIVSTLAVVMAIIAAVGLLHWWLR
jgi:hypothetical protein